MSYLYKLLPLKKVPEIFLSRKGIFQKLKFIYQEQQNLIFLINIFGEIDLSRTAKSDFSD